jgi:hypothetical protein
MPLLGSGSWGLRDVYAGWLIWARLEMSPALARLKYGRIKAGVEEPSAHKS